LKKIARSRYAGLEALKVAGKNLRAAGTRWALPRNAPNGAGSRWSWAADSSVSFLFWKKSRDPHSATRGLRRAEGFFPFSYPALTHQRASAPWDVLG